MSRSSLWMTGSLTAIVLLVAATTTGAPPRSGHLNIEQALDRQQQLVAQDPSSASAQNDLGNLLILVGDVVGAEQAYQKGLELDPTNTGIFFNYGVLLQQVGRNRDALAIYRQLLDIDPNHAWARYQLGTLYADKHQRRAAIEQYARAFALDPQLSFPELNPHVIENSLAVESLIRAQRYRNLPGVNVPRQYGDPEQIAQWMLETERAIGQGGQSSDVVVEGQPVMGRSGSAKKKGDDENRRLTPEDLEDSQLGQASGGSSGPRYSRSVPGGASSHVRSSGSATRLPRTTTAKPYSGPSTSRNGDIGSSKRPETEERLSAEKIREMRERLRSSRLSTGRLQLELLPAESAGERLALATPAGW